MRRKSLKWYMWWLNVAIIGADPDMQRAVAEPVVAIRPRVEKVDGRPQQRQLSTGSLDRGLVRLR